jgi:redox-sensitive bicupin YhaK (pirin superfamily)
MTAGAGIQHIETPPEKLVASGGLFHGVQLWVNLPAAQKWTPASYQDIEARDVTLLANHDGSSLLRLIAGELAGHLGPGATRTPITYLHATVAPRAADAAVAARVNALVYALRRGYAATSGGRRMKVSSPCSARPTRLRWERSCAAIQQPGGVGDPGPAADPRAGGALRPFR